MKMCSVHLHTWLMCCHTMVQPSTQPQRFTQRRQGSKRAEQTGLALLLDLRSSQTVYCSMFK